MNASPRLGQRISREEMIAAAFRRYEQSVIEEALGDDAAAVLPDALRLVELRARVPRYQREMLRYFAGRDGTSVDTVLSGQLNDVASAHSEELAEHVSGFAAALRIGERRSRRAQPSHAILPLGSQCVMALSERRKTS